MAKATNAHISRSGLLRGGLVFLTSAAIAFFAQTLETHAAKPITYIVLDAASGQILNEHGADELNYPASLTKMMTLFLTFDALEHHQITLNSEFTVSPHGAAQQPSKLGLTPGSTISVQDLILAVVTHSANDAAVTLAEGLAGSEAAFAARMNHEAQALGMTRTNFRNASGLPDRFQYTTARDLSKLALALYRTFPNEYHYFATERFTYRGQTYGNHNHLMAAFPGMDGIKTGFINASGFNLAASAVRSNRRLVGVIMGGRSAGSRDMEMAALLDDGFAHRDGTSRVASVALRKNEELTASGAPVLQRAAEFTAPTEDEDSVSVRVRHHRFREAHYSRHSRHHHIRLASYRHGRHRGIVLASYETVVHHAHHGNRHSANIEHHHYRRIAGHHLSGHHHAGWRSAHLHEGHRGRFRHGMRTASLGRRHAVMHSRRGHHRATLRSA